jgi:hypothetical protein
VNLDRRFRLSILAVVAQSLATYAAAEESLLRGVLAFLWAAGGWWVTESRQGRGLPRWAVGLVLTVVVLWAVVEVYLRGLTVSPFSGFLAAIIVVKMWERRQPRDYAQILSISLFLNIGSILNSSSVVVGLCLALGVPLFVHAVMLLQVFLAAHKSGTPLAQAPQASRAGVQLSAITAGSVALGLLLSAAIFVAVPRGLGQRTLGAFGAPILGRVSGFNSRVELGQAGLISQSQAVALTLRIETNNTLWLNTVQRQGLYLRGAILTSYRDGVWQLPGREPPDAYEEFPGALDRMVFWDEPASAYADLIIQDRPSVHASRPIFASWRPIAVRLGSGANAVTRRRATDSLTATGSGGSLAYTVRCDVSRPTADTPWTRRTVRAPTPVVGDYARRVLTSAGVEPDPAKRPTDDDRRAVRELENELRRTCAYTLDVLAPPPGEDAVEWFLTKERRGHCEYFACALALLCRSVGIETRVVTGYLASEIDPATNQVTVRQSNAHAWVEARVGEHEWRTSDATPAESLDAMLRPELGVRGRLDRFLERIQDAWSTSVVNFDQSVRGRLFSDWSKSRLAGLLNDLRRTARASGTPATIAIVIAGVVLLAVAVRAAARLRPALRGANASLPWLSARGKGAPARAYQKLLAELQRHGLAKPHWTPPLDHADAIERVSPVAAGALRTIAPLCYQAWFRGTGWTLHEQTQARAALRTLAQARPK